MTAKRVTLHDPNTLVVFIPDSAENSVVMTLHEAQSIKHITEGTIAVPIGRIVEKPAPDYTPRIGDVWDVGLGNTVMLLSDMLKRAETGEKLYTIRISHSNPRVVTRDSACTIHVSIDHEWMQQLLKARSSSQLSYESYPEVSISAAREPSEIRVGDVFRNTDPMGEEFIKIIGIEKSRIPGERGQTVYWFLAHSHDVEQLCFEGTSTQGRAVSGDGTFKSLEFMFNALDNNP